MQLKLSLATVAICAAQVLGAVIVPGATWTDTSGNVIQAHGAGLLKVRTDADSLLSLVDTVTNRSGRLSTGSAKTNHTIAASLRLFLVTRYTALSCECYVYLNP